MWKDFSEIFYFSQCAEIEPVVNWLRKPRLRTEWLQAPISPPPHPCKYFYNVTSASALLKTVF
jgi:hypothetical protein